MAAGHQYQVAWVYTVSIGHPRLKAATLYYDHLERFALKATAGCGQTDAATYFIPLPAPTS
jgi:hypothetical protein